MLTITKVSNSEGFTVKQALEFSQERGVYLAPVTWTGETLMFCILPERLQQEFSQTIENRANRKITGNLPQFSHAVNSRGYGESCEHFTQEQG